LCGNISNLEMLFAGKVCLRVGTYNCQSAKSNISLIEDLLCDLDILMLQETFLNDNSHDILNCFGPDFDYTYVSAERKSSNFFGRCSGGLAIIWRVNSGLRFIPKYYSNRIMGLEISSMSSIYLFINVYFPYDRGNIESFIDYRSCMSELDTYIREAAYDHILIAGDFNCDPSKGRFFPELVRFTGESSLHVRDVQFMSPDSYTFISRNSVSSTSWIDHVVTSYNCNPYNFEIIYGFTVDDHIPLTFLVEIEGNLFDDSVPYVDALLSTDGVCWDKLNADIINSYCGLLERLSVDYRSDVFSCSDASCEDVHHIGAIGQSYDDVLAMIKFASNMYLSSKSRVSRPFKKVPGWNEYCRDAHNIARSAFLQWHHGGKIREGQLFDEMKRTRAVFRRALRFCKSNEVKIRRENFASKFDDRNKTKFWKEVRKLNIDSFSTHIDGISDKKDITEIFANKYRNILCNSAFVEYDNLISANDEGRGMSRIFFRKEIIDRGIDRLNNGWGNGNIHSNHLKFSGFSFRLVLSRLFSSMISHGYIPKDMLKGQIKPVIKNKNLGKDNSDNYRPVMNSSMLLKLFEYCLLPVIQDKLKLNPLQFGFTAGSDCESAVTFARETIFSYTGANSNIHCVAVDLSKAFDRVNVGILTKKLISSDIPRSLVRTIHYMLSETYVNVCYGGFVGEEWKVMNGVRQGGILSPILFNYYINDCIEVVSSMREGCRLCYQPANIICYADDILLLAPSAHGLQKLISQLEANLGRLQLMINVSKTNYIVFKCSKAANVQSRVYSSDIILQRVDCIKYLGVYLTDELSLHRDIDRVLSSFLKQFNAMYYKFNFVDPDILYYLFKTYACSFYGVAMWYGRTFKSCHVRKLAIAYHKAVKKVAHMNIWDSNHAACEKVRVDTFPHLIAKKLVSFYSRIGRSKCSMFVILRSYFLSLSNISKFVGQLMRDNYQVNDVLSNDTDALISRISFTQANEPRSCYAAA